MALCFRPCAAGNRGVDGVAGGQWQPAGLHLCPLAQVLPVGGPGAQARAADRGRQGHDRDLQHLLLHVRSADLKPCEMHGSGAERSS